MAVHDQQDRSRYDNSGATGKWVAFVIGLGLLAMVAFIFMAGSDTYTGDAVRQTPQNPTTTTAPRTTTPAPTAPTTQPK